MCTDDDQSRVAYLQAAYEIIDTWERQHSRRLLATRDAAQLAEAIAQALHSAYELGRRET
jgi:hypothetical protein